MDISDFKNEECNKDRCRQRYRRSRRIQLTFCQNLRASIKSRGKDFSPDIILLDFHF